MRVVAIRVVRRRGVVLLATLLAVVGLFAFLSVMVVQVTRSVGAGQQGEKRLREDITRVLDLPVAPKPVSPSTPTRGNTP